MGRWKRLFSSDYRAAVAAEAAGDLELAAERYALAGHPDAAARVHLARAERARTRHDEIAALRDAVQWAEGEIRKRAERALGLALVAQARAEAIATDRDKKRVREAAALLASAGEHRAAAEAHELIGDLEAAAAAYRAGGLLPQLEAALAREADRGSRDREVREAWADFELAERGGQRDAAIAALRRAVAAAVDDRAEYRRRLDQLEGRLLTAWRLELAPRRGGRVIAIGGARLVIGRDPLAEVALRTAGVSRAHAEVRRDEAGFVLADVGSRNGTRVGGLPIAAPLRLADAGRVGLGDACELDYRIAAGGALRLAIDRGVDRGTIVWAAAPDGAIDLAEDGVAASIRFDHGRPYLAAARELVLNGERLVRVEVQPIRGDQLVVDDVELEVR